MKSIRYPGYRIIELIYYFLTRRRIYWFDFELNFPIKTCCWSKFESFAKMICYYRIIIIVYRGKSFVTAAFATYYCIITAAFATYYCIVTAAFATYYCIITAAFATYYCVVTATKHWPWKCYRIWSHAKIDCRISQQVWESKFNSRHVKIIYLNSIDVTKSINMF